MNTLWPLVILPVDDGWFMTLLQETINQPGANIAVSPGN